VKKVGPPVKDSSATQFRGPRYRTPLWLGASAAIAVILLGASALVATPSFAAGTTSNTISVGGDPLGASTGGYYVATATATSKDTVVISLDPTSTGCRVSGAKVLFTGAGECVIDFNDPGNASFMAAQQVTQSIKVYAINTITPGDAPTEGSVDGYYSPLATATSGDVVIVSLAPVSTGCALSQGKLSFKKQGTCQVELNDPGNGAYAAAKEVTQKITIYTANLIHPSTAPKTGAINGTYYASATASSHDAVVISLDATSTGCGLVVQRVTFTSDGFCRVDFNDAGDGAYGPAKQIQKTITVGAGGQKAQAELYLSSLNATKGVPLTLTSSGGSGSGAVTYRVDSGTSNCSLTAGVLSAQGVGDCAVTVSKAADGGYLSTQSVASLVNVNLAGSPRALRTSGTALRGRTVTLEFVGTGFYGRPTAVSSSADTRVNVSSVSGTAVRVSVATFGDAPLGVHDLTLRFAHGQRTSALYVVR
jgi:hypothetical protein